VEHGGSRGRFTWDVASWELTIESRVPRKATPIVVYQAADEPRLRRMSSEDGLHNVSSLLAAWRVY